MMLQNVQDGWLPARFAGNALKWLWYKNKPVTITVVLVVGVIKMRKYMKKQERRKNWNNAGKDVVVLHIPSRGFYCPSLSPFVVKLETYIRMAEIPHVIDHEEPMGPKGKTPWITLNGEDMGDSQMIIEKLAAKFGKEFDAHLSQEEKAVAHSLRIMVDEYFVWCLGVYRYGQERGRHLALNASIPWFYRPVLAMYFKRYLEAAKTQGIGRHSYRDIEEMGRKSLQSLSAWLGEKPFMMGANPTELDCTVFGMLAFDVFCPPLSPFKRMLEKDYRNLHAYCHRMKEKFWPDWDKCLDPHRQ
ncbi:failed axon connections homolog [Penaeus monodon]|uniref:failed axon connections homolog n=1 Tax=Penaeus monodon TaxID=6687 RepID=UPI0018A7C141|nr:failed axon connections homolog [Penaeus monodon]